MEGEAPSMRSVLRRSDSLSMYPRKEGPKRGGLYSSGSAPRDEGSRGEGSRDEGSRSGGEDEGGSSGPSTVAAHLARSSCCSCSAARRTRDGLRGLQRASRCVCASRGKEKASMGHEKAGTREGGDTRRRQREGAKALREGMRRSEPRELSHEARIRSLWIRVH